MKTIKKRNKYLLKLKKKLDKIDELNNILITDLMKFFPLPGGKTIHPTEVDALEEYICKTYNLIEKKVEKAFDFIASELNKIDEELFYPIEEELLWQITGKLHDFSMCYELNPRDIPEEVMMIKAAGECHSETIRYDAIRIKDKINAILVYPLRDSIHLVERMLHDLSKRSSIGDK